jgi:hypothetical protein
VFGFAAFVIGYQEVNPKAIKVQGNDATACFH